MGILIKNIDFKIKNKYILKNINLNVNVNEILTILGPNGSGKSSLIKLMAGDFNAKYGKILFDNKDIREISIDEQAKIRSVMSQSQEIVYDYLVRDIIEMGWIKNEDNKTFEISLKKVSSECNIDKILERKYNSLSGGEQRNVNFARTLIQLDSQNTKKNKYYILDEPTANLDISHKISMMNILKKKKAEGYGIILVLHDLNLAYKCSDRIGLMKNGELKYIGKAQEICTNKILSSIYDTKVSVDRINKTINYY